MSLTYVDQDILANDGEWKARVQQSVAQNAFVLLQEDHENHDFQEARRRQTLCIQVIDNPLRHTARIALILATVEAIPPEAGIFVDTQVAANAITDAQLCAFIDSNWSSFAGVGSDLPDMG